MEGLLFAVILVMTLYLIGSRRPRHGRQRPNQPGYSDDFDDFDDYQQPYYPQQHTGNQPIIILRGGQPYPPRHYREESSPFPAILLVVAILSIAAAVYYHNFSNNGEANTLPRTNQQEELLGNEPSGQNGQEQTSGFKIYPRPQEQKVKPLPTPPPAPFDKKTVRPRPNKISYVLYLGDYTSIEGVNALKEIYNKKKIVGVRINGVYWACMPVGSEDAAWEEMQHWKQYDNDYRKYGLDPEIRNLNEYCDELSWASEGDMLICD